MSRADKLRLFTQARRLLARLLHLSSDNDRDMFYASLHGDSVGFSRAMVRQARLERLGIKSKERCIRRELDAAGDVELN